MHALATFTSSEGQRTFFRTRAQPIAAFAQNRAKHRRDRGAAGARSAIGLPTLPHCAHREASGAVCSGLSELRRFVSSFADLRLIRIDRAPRQGEVLCQRAVRAIASARQRPLPPLASAAKLPRLPSPARSGSRHHAALPQDLASAARTARALAYSAALRRPLYPEGFVACFRRQCRLSLGAMPRCRKILPQLRGQLALVMCGLTRMENPTTPFGLGCWVLFPLSKYPQEAPAGALGAAEHHR